jgi:hypothetical protein
LLAISAAPALAKETASIKPVSGAERATTVRPEALEPRVYGKIETTKCHRKVRPVTK